jgi:hypothetical protein
LQKLKEGFVLHPVLKKTSLGFLKFVSIFSETDMKDDMVKQEKTRQKGDNWFFVKRKIPDPPPPPPLNFGRWGNWGRGIFIGRWI